MEWMNGEDGEDGEDNLLSLFLKSKANKKHSLQNSKMS